MLSSTRDSIVAIREPGNLFADSNNRRMGEAAPASSGSGGDTAGTPALASLAPIYPEWLGDQAFNQAHGVRFAYIAGEMATGIATTSMVIAMAKARMLGFFGAAGLPIEEIARALDEIEGALGGPGAATPSWGINLIHSPNEPDLEEALVTLYLRRKVWRVCASAFMAVTPSVVRFACTGLRMEDGRIQRSNYLFAKISRPEVAQQFMSPAPTAILERLVAQGRLTRQEAELAAHIPLAEDITAEADSGGHTDNRPLTVLLPLILSVRNRLQKQYGYDRAIRVGAAGSIGTPGAVAAAFALGAAYVGTGSINQAAIESGTSATVKNLLAQAGMADVMMAPAADMFELGVKVQVLKRGTLFGTRAAKLYQVYSSHSSIEAIPESVRRPLERDIFRKPLEEIWATTRDYWVHRDMSEVERAEREPKHKMALVFRWYLGSASRWALTGEPGRELDYQIWCGPAMGSFNDWVKGSFLEEPANRSVVEIALNLLEGAAVITRAHQLRSSGVAVAPEAFEFSPQPLMKGPTAKSDLGPSSRHAGG